MDRPYHCGNQTKQKRRGGKRKTNEKLNKKQETRTGELVPSMYEEEGGKQSEQAVARWRVTAKIHRIW
jgi:hypothetical protein